jgi:MFS family permease
MAWFADGLAPLRERDFRLFFIGQSASLLGDGISLVALSFAVLDLTGSAADLGDVLAAKAVPMIVMLLFGGVLADRWSRRLVIIVADGARFVIQGVVAVLLLTGHATVWELALLAAAHGIASALFYPAATGLMPEVVSESGLQQANALRGLALSAGNIGGPAIAGLVIAQAGTGAAMALDSASFAVSALFMVAVRVPARAQAEAGGSLLAELREGWREFTRRRWVWLTVSGMSLSNMLFGVLLVLGPVLTTRGLGGAPAWAAIMTAFGIGSLVGGTAALRIRTGRPMLVAALAVTVFPLCAAGLALRLPVAEICLLGFVSGIGLTVFNALWETTLQRSVPLAALSRVSAYDWLGSVACLPVGQAGSGPFAVAFGAGPALGISAIAQAGLAIVLLAVPDLRRFRLAPAAARDDQPVAEVAATLDDEVRSAAD